MEADQKGAGMGITIKRRSTRRSVNAYMGFNMGSDKRGRNSGAFSDFYNIR